MLPLMDVINVEEKRNANDAMFVTATQSEFECNDLKTFRVKSNALRITQRDRWLRGDRHCVIRNQR